MYPIQLNECISRILYAGDNDVNFFKHAIYSNLYRRPRGSDVAKLTKGLI